MAPIAPIVLVTVSGPDRPGITSTLTGVLAGSRATVLDVGQAVIHGLLSLSILFESTTDEQAHQQTIKDLLFQASNLGLKLEYQVVPAGFAKSHHLNPASHRYALTLIADKITALALHTVSRKLVEHKLNIDFIQRLSDQDFGCVEMQLSSPSASDVKDLKKELLQIARDQQIDIALQAEGLFRRAKRLVVMDMDSTLIQNEVIDELAREKGVYEQVSQITREAMKGEMPYRDSLVKRVALLEGLEQKDLDRVFDRLELTPGAAELIQVLRKLGYKVAVISGGFTFVAERFQQQLGIDYVYANTLEIINGRVTGKVIPPIVGPQRKAELLDALAQQEKIDLDQVIAIGDGANDLPMLAKAGLGIAFNAKPLVSEKADLSLNRRNLRSVFYLLGISGKDLAQILPNS